MKLTDIETPAALIDETRMTNNIERMQERMTALGVRFRPHVKTIKCIDVARAAGGGGGRHHGLDAEGGRAVLRRGLHATSSMRSASRRDKLAAGAGAAPRAAAT